MPSTITVKHEVSDQFLADVLTTAVESGGHAFWYWEGFSMLDISRAVEGPPDGALDNLSVYRVKFVVDHPQEQDEYIIDLEDVAKGIQWILDGTVPVAKRLVDYITSAISDEDAGDIDAEAADVIVQACAFKELVFG